MFTVRNFSVALIAVLIICTVSQVELTPIVGGNEIEKSNQSSTNENVVANVEDLSAPITVLQNATSLVHNETLVTRENNSTATKNSEAKDQTGTTRKENAEVIVSTNITASELLKSIANNSNNSLDDFGAMQVVVSSKPLLVVETNLSTSTSTPSSENITVVNLPVNIGSNESSDGFDYKKKARPSFYPYMEQLLRSDALQNDTTSQSYPTILKSEKYAADQNSVLGYANLPDFSEKDMNKRRLNHWRLRHVMKGVDMNDQNKKLGQSGNKNGFPIVFGQTRAALPPDSSATGKPEFVQDVRNNGDSKPRSFFSWFSNPLKGKLVTNADDSLLQQAKAQQAVLPFALSYRGDFLFW